ncbi:MAG: flippase [Streptococcus orisratti]|uniref:flippase n=1 Tax=Streptococcus orisratti TaxID=114652 RepID=UPI002355D340|nr:flippase [Streptococcus orisratti]MCI7678042.1 flippase [Streptococcus orisratti]
MSTKNKIGINVIYNMSYQILAIIVPLLTSPYISRVLGAEQIGIDSYTSSVVFYFVIFAILGINNYGNRTIASEKGRVSNLSQIFSNIYIIQLIMSIVMTLLYLAYILLFVDRYILIFYIQIFQILANMVDVTWYFYGKEEFKVTVLRNSFVKIIGLVLIFIFVKNSGDLWKYTLITVGSAFLGQACIWPFLLKEVQIVRPVWIEVKKHIKPIIILFIPVLAISIFTNIDKLMIGQFSSVIQNGYYENANKIIGIPKALVTALGTVMLPRTAALLSNGKEDKSRYYVEVTIMYTTFFSSALMFGMMAVAERFAVLFWGKDFVFSGILIIGLAPAFVFSVIGNVVRTQYLIPRARDKEYTISLIIGAAVNIIINYFFIPVWGSVGAVIGTVIAEFLMTLLQVHLVRKEISIYKYILNSLPFYFFGLVMYFVIILLGNFFSANSFVNLLILISCGGISYFLLCIGFMTISKNMILKNLLSKILK